MKNENPFIYGSYLRPKYFCNRKIETDNILENIRQNKNILLVGRNGLGKTTLIKHVFYHLKKREDFILVYFDVLKITSINGFFEELFISTILEIAEISVKKSKKLEELLFNDSVSEVKKGQDLIKTELQQKINDYFDFINSFDQKIVIAVDNYQLASQFPPTIFDEQFVSKFTKSNNSLILSGSKKTFVDPSFEVVEVKKISQEEYRKFIIKQFSSIGYSISEKSIKRIFEFSDRETRAVQILCAKIVEKNDKKIKSKIIEEVIHSLIIEYSPNFEMIKYLLSPYQWRLLSAIAIENEALYITSKGFIEKYKLNAPSSVKTALDALLEKELIYRIENSYFISNSIFRHWLTDNS